MELSIWMVLASSLLLVVHKCCYGNDCVFQYIQQPPSNLSCNPYNNTASPSQLQLTLACGAQRNDHKQNEWTFDLRWFSNYSGDALNDALDHVIDVRTPSFTNSTLLVLSPGQYWCQVLDYTDGSDGHLLARSNVVEVLSWECYSSLPTCIGNQSVMEKKCADLSLSPSASPPAISKCPVLHTLTTKIPENTISGMTSVTTGSIAIQLTSLIGMMAETTGSMTIQPTNLPGVEDCSLVAGLSVTLTFFLTAIISSLLTLLLSWCLYVHRKERKATPTGPVPLYEIPSSGSGKESLMISPNVAYGHVLSQSAAQSSGVYDNVAP